jgi:hypothetical protein
MSVAKLNPNGTLDSLFGQNGISELNLPEEVPAGALAVQDDGKIVVCGRAVDSLYNSKIVIARFLNNLSLGLLNFSKEGSEYYVYPNPIVDHAFTVQFNLAEDEVMSVRLMDSQGKWIQNYFDHENKLKGDHTLNLIWPDYLPSGHYFITFETSQGYSTLQLLKP